MKIQIDGKYRLRVKIALVLVPILSIAVSFLALPLMAAIVISTLLVIIPIVLNRFVFKYHALHVMPIPTDDVIRYALGTTWVADDLDTLAGLGLAIIYKYKESAKDTFNLLKAWNYGKIIDRDANITLSAVREGNDRYSVYVYPGDRMDSLEGTKKIVEESKGPNAEASLSVVKFYLQFCFDYSADELKKKCIESLPYVKELILNVAYVENDEIVMYSKTGFRLQKFFIQDRGSQALGGIEKAIPWSDLRGEQPEIHRAVTERINERIETSRKCM